MRHARLIVLIAALLLGACGAQPAAQPADQPVAAQAETAPSAAAPTEDLFLSPSSASAPSPPAPSAAATAAPPTDVAPTARLILPAATSAPTAGAAPQTAPTDAPEAQATPPAPASTQPSQPVRMKIADIALDGRLVSVGLDKERIPIVPEHDVGWYNLSAMPGQGENIVLWGHVLRFRDAPKIPAPFARLKELKPGAAVTLYDSDGNAHSYVVTKQVWVTPDQVEYILPRGKEMVTMVSCIGDKIIQDGSVVDESHRLITIAEPAA